MKKTTFLLAMVALDVALAVGVAAQDKPTAAQDKPTAAQDKPTGAKQPVNPAPARLAPPASFAPTDEEELRVKLAYDEAQIAYQAYQLKSQGFFGACGAVREAHGWPVTVTCNMAPDQSAVIFYDQPAPPAVKPTPAPPLKK